jgi:hypothetical protein
MHPALAQEKSTSEIKQPGGVFLLRPFLFFRSPWRTRGAGDNVDDALRLVSFQGHSTANGVGFGSGGGLDDPEGTKPRVQPPPRRWWSHKKRKQDGKQATWKTPRPRGDTPCWSTGWSTTPVACGRFPKITPDVKQTRQACVSQASRTGQLREDLGYLGITHCGRRSLMHSVSK